MTAPAGGAPAPFRVLVTGSRSWVDIRAVVVVLDGLLAEHGGGLVVVHGGCPSGADAIAAEWAGRRGVPVEVWPADWTAHGRRAGLIRNVDMVASRLALCVAFIRGRSPGASHCAATAQEAGVPTRAYRVASRPVRLRRSREPGWRMPAGAVYVGRPSKWGNPFRNDGTRDGRRRAVVLFRRQLAARPDLVALARAELAGRDLVCWCPPDHPCHADVWLELANANARDAGSGTVVAR